MHQTNGFGAFLVTWCFGGEMFFLSTYGFKRIILGVQSITKHKALTDNELFGNIPYTPSDPFSATPPH